MKGNLSSIELAFAICAAIGGVLFLSRVASQMLGLGRNATVDRYAADIAAVRGDVLARLLSFQSTTAFLMMFGLVGLAMERVQKAGAPVSFAAALIGGTLTAWAVSQLFRGKGGMRSVYEFNPAQTIGQRGSVYQPIPADGPGKVTVTINDRLSVLDAVAQDKQPINAGEAVQVVNIIGENILLVKRV